jgi:GTPase
MFIDEAVIFVQSGKGGDGVVHFRREKYVPRGGPDGGDGGRGGSVILEVVPTLNTLSTFRQNRKFRAEEGGNGAKQNMTGKSADDLIILIPPGTLVFDNDSGELLGDLVEPGQQLKVVQGGRGGRGNARFASSVNQVPRVAEKGVPGEQRNLRLELKLIADIGIVGVPNAGKSTLLSVVTNARPKIADYPFTTLEPNLGVAQLDEDNTLVLADIPGLIEGAHMGVGLGHDFLRHIQRTRVLIHVLDGTAEDPMLDFSQINSELALFDPALGKKSQVVAFNKMDLDEAKERWPAVEKQLKRRGYQAFAISAAAAQNLRPLLYQALELLKEAREQVEAEVDQELPVYRAETDPRQYTIERVPEGWQVRGASIERAAAMTYWEHYQAVERFQRIMRALGIEDALRKAGVQEGDTVFIGDYELEWTD